MTAPATIPSDFVRRSVVLAEANGVDLAPALNAARISRAVLAHPHARLTPRAGHPVHPEDLGTHR